MWGNRRDWMEDDDQECQQQALDVEDDLFNVYSSIFTMDMTVNKL